VARAIRVTRVPGAPTLVRGIVNVRGVVVTVPGTFRAARRSPCRYVVVDRPA
jgi:hypothetical protein